MDGNWVEMEIGEVDWVQGEDTILKSQMAVGDGDDRWRICRRSNERN